LRRTSELHAAIRAIWAVWAAAVETGWAGPRAAAASAGSRSKLGETGGAAVATAAAPAPHHAWIPRSRRRGRERPGLGRVGEGQFLRGAVVVERHKAVLFVNFYDLDVVLPLALA